MKRYPATTAHYRRSYNGRQRDPAQGLQEGVQVDDKIDIQKEIDAARLIQAAERGRQGRAATRRKHFLARGRL
eukprot:SAG31_NODE_13670_length_854_cov_1.092715_2_plen_72_part_01